jgi:hypothetical protein
MRILLLTYTWQRIFRYFQLATHFMRILLLKYTWQRIFRYFQLTTHSFIDHLTIAISATDSKPGQVEKARIPSTVCERSRFKRSQFNFSNENFLPDGTKLFSMLPLWFTLFNSTGNGVLHGFTRAFHTFKIYSECSPENTDRSSFRPKSQVCFHWAHFHKPHDHSINFCWRSSVYRRGWLPWHLLFTHHAATYPTEGTSSHRTLAYKRRQVTGVRQIISRQMCIYCRLVI